MSCPDCGSESFTGSHGCNPIDIAYYSMAKLQAKYEEALADIEAMNEIILAEQKTSKDLLDMFNEKSTAFEKAVAFIKEVSECKWMQCVEMRKAKELLKELE